MRKRANLGPHSEHIQRRVVQHDATTGEVLGELYANVPPRAKSGFVGGFVMVALALRDLVREIRSAQALRLLLDLLCRLEYGGKNQIWIKQSAIAQDLGMPRQNVALALKRLEGLGIILRERNGVYWLNPELAWRGPTDDHTGAIEEYRNLRIRPWRDAGIPDGDRVIICEQWQAQA